MAPAQPLQLLLARLSFKHLPQAPIEVKHKSAALSQNLALTCFLFSSFTTYTPRPALEFYPVNRAASQA
jgi:hypothetical protein